MALEFPPLLTGIAVPGDPFRAACDAAETTEPGAVFYGSDEQVMRAAIVLAPEVPLREAVGVSFAVSLGLNDAIGALAPPEVAVHLDWPDRLRVNGALCGRLRACASTTDALAEPDWIVIGAEVPVLATGEAEPGEAPEETCLFEEGCGEITTPLLIETWARHMMNWLHIYLTDGFAPLHEDWRAKGYRLGETVEGGTFLGLDEWGGMILKDGSDTRILPLTQMVEAP